MRCWYCGGQLNWNCEYDYSDIYDEGEGVITILNCTNNDCMAEVNTSRMYDKGRVE